MGPTDDVPLNYTVTIRGIYTTVEKGKVTLIDGHSPNPCFCLFALLGSIVFSRGSKKVLFWRTVQEQGWSDNVRTRTLRKKEAGWKI